MPKFTDKERDAIEEKLLKEGERLFTAFGLKKVTVDELAKAAGISKGSFYAFYQSKEHLFMVISGRLQNQMRGQMNAYLEEHRALPPKELFRQCYLWMFEELQKYPMLLQANGEIAEHLYRKLPAEIIEEHTKEDEEALVLLQAYGIRFKCDIDIATNALQTLAITFLNLQQENNQNQQKVMDILLTGAINELVEDAND